MSEKPLPDELNFMELRRLDLMDGGTRSRDYLRKYGVKVQVDDKNQVVSPPLEEMREKLEQLDADIDKALRTN